MQKQGKRAPNLQPVKIFKKKLRTPRELVSPEKLERRNVSPLPVDYSEYSQKNQVTSHTERSAINCKSTEVSDYDIMRQTFNINRDRNNSSPFVSPTRNPPSES